MGEHQPEYAGQQMSNLKPTETYRRSFAPRSGHGAASVIPHLNDVVQLEPPHLNDAMPDEDSAREDEQASDDPEEKRADGD